MCKDTLFVANQGQQRVIFVANHGQQRVKFVANQGQLAVAFVANHGQQVTTNIRNKVGTMEVYAQKQGKMDKLQRHHYCENRQGTEARTAGHGTPLYPIITRLCSIRSQEESTLWSE